MEPVNELWTTHLGTVEYREAAALQERLRERVIAGELPPLLLLLEHPPVYTLGRRSDPADLPFGADFWRAQGIDVVQTPRGGRLTYHAPGQLVGYPIMPARRHPGLHPHDGAGARRRPRRGGRSRRAGATTRARSSPASGSGTARSGRSACTSRRGVSMHGFAVNVDNDVEPFHQVTACGLPDVRMTSIALETGRTGGLPCFRKRVAYAYAQAHGMRQRIVHPARLEDRAAVPA